jgi:hypothetical protein
MKLTNVKSKIVEHGGKDRKACYLLLPAKVAGLFGLENGEVEMDVETSSWGTRITIKGD